MVNNSHHIRTSNCDSNGANNASNANYNTMDRIRNDSSCINQFLCPNDTEIEIKRYKDRIVCQCRCGSNYKCEFDGIYNKKKAVDNFYKFHEDEEKRENEGNQMNELFDSDDSDELC
jgi:hypothetical protein